MTSVCTADIALISPDPRSPTLLDPHISKGIAEGSRGGCSAGDLHSQAGKNTPPVSTGNNSVPTMDHSYA